MPSLTHLFGLIWASYPRRALKDAPLWLDVHSELQAGGCSASHYTETPCAGLLSCICLRFCVPVVLLVVTILVSTPCAGGDGSRAKTVASHGVVEQLGHFVSHGFSVSVEPSPSAACFPVSEISAGWASSGSSGCSGAFLLLDDRGGEIMKVETGVVVLTSTTQLP